MKRLLMACALAGIFAGTACAQGNVTIYGIADTGIAKSTGSDIRIGSNVDSRIGFRGTEDLGDGLKAEFNLERCVNLSDGTRGARHPNYQDQTMQMGEVIRTGDKSRVWQPPEWQSVANIGFRSDTFGAVHIGRVVNYAIENYRSLDPFYQNGVSAGLYTLVDSEVNANTLRYDSPNWNGFSFGLAYTIGENTNPRSRNEGGAYLNRHHIDNDGWLVGGRYRNGGLDLLANYEKIVDSNDSYKWNLGAAYTFSDASWGSLKVSAVMSRSQSKLSMAWERRLRLISSMGLTILSTRKTRLLVCNTGMGRIPSTLLTIMARLNTVRTARTTNMLWAIPTACPSAPHCMRMPLIWMRMMRWLPLPTTPTIPTFGQGMIRSSAIRSVSPISSDNLDGLKKDGLSRLFPCVFRMSGYTC